MDDAQKDHPRDEFASPSQRPSAIHAVSVRGDLCLPRGARTVGGNDIGVGVDGSRSIRGELGGSPMGVAIPYAPRARGIRPPQLLENLHRFHWREIEPAIRFGKKDAKKSGA